LVNAAAVLVGSDRKYRAWAEQADDLKAFREIFFAAGEGHGRRNGEGLGGHSVDKHCFGLSLWIGDAAVGTRFNQ